MAERQRKIAAGKEESGLLFDLVGTENTSENVSNVGDYVSAGNVDPAYVEDRSTETKKGKVQRKKKLEVKGITKKGASKKKKRQQMSSKKTRSAKGSEGKGARREGKNTGSIAEILAQQQREISVSEFFAKNRHLLGFDNPKKALLTTIKEAVDNSLDACEEAGILPEIEVIVKQLSEDRFIVSVTDNGPGIVKSQIPHIFGRLLYGSKFHTLKMSRGQQGIGISAAGMYGILTTGVPVKVTSRIGPKEPAHYYELQIDTKRNQPEIVREDEGCDFPYEHGTRVEITLQARYTKGRTSVDEYLRQTAIANPHLHLRYVNPDGELIEFKRVTNSMPPQPKVIKPHPYGIELGVLINMLKDAEEKRLESFLVNNFSRVSSKVAKEIIKVSGLSEKMPLKKMSRSEIERLYEAMNKVKVLSPPTDCLVPIGEENLEEGLKAIVKADFYTSVTRPPAVYRGNPFVVEAALAYGKAEDINEYGSIDDEDEIGLGSPDGRIDVEGNGELIRLLRFANRVPLLYQQSACAIYKAVVSTNWRNYHLQQAKGALPSGPAVLLVHIASVWVPFTSESKEAIAHYPEIIKEIKLAIQECGRRLARYLSRQKRIKDELKKKSFIEKYIPHIGIALKDILELDDKKTEKVVEGLKRILEKTRKIQ